MNDEMKTTTEVSGPWECFSDPSYYDMARLRRKDGPKDFNTGFHLNTLREAQELRNILNSYEAQEEERLLKVMEYCRKWADEHLAGHGKETFYARLGLLVDFATDLYRDEIQKLKEAKP